MSVGTGEVAVEQEDPTRVTAESAVTCLVVPLTPLKEDPAFQSLRLALIELLARDPAARILVLYPLRALAEASSISISTRAIRISSSSVVGRSFTGRPVCTLLTSASTIFTESAALCTVNMAFAWAYLRESRVAQPDEPDAPRPIRPAQDRINGNYLGNDPASTQVRHRPVDLQAHAALAASLRGLAPEQR